MSEGGGWGWGSSWSSISAAVTSTITDMGAQMVEDAAFAKTLIGGEEEENPQGQEDSKGAESSEKQGDEKQDERSQEKEEEKNGEENEKKEEELSEKKEGEGGFRSLFDRVGNSQTIQQQQQQQQQPQKEGEEETPETQELDDLILQTFMTSTNFLTDFVSTSTDFVASSSEQVRTLATNLNATELLDQAGKSALWIVDPGLLDDVAENEKGKEEEGVQKLLEGGGQEISFEKLLEKHGGSEKLKILKSESEKERTSFQEKRKVLGVMKWSALSPFFTRLEKALQSSFPVKQEREDEGEEEHDFKVTFEKLKNFSPSSLSSSLSSSSSSSSSSSPSPSPTPSPSPSSYLGPLKNDIKICQQLKLLDCLYVTSVDRLSGEKNVFRNEKEGEGNVLKIAVVFLLKKREEYLDEVADFVHLFVGLLLAVSEGLKDQSIVQNMKESVGAKGEKEEEKDEDEDEDEDDEDDEDDEEEMVNKAVVNKSVELCGVLRDLFIFQIKRLYHLIHLQKDVIEDVISESRAGLKGVEKKKEEEKEEGEKKEGEEEGEEKKREGEKKRNQQQLIELAKFTRSYLASFSVDQEESSVVVNDAGSSMRPFFDSFLLDLCNL